MLTQEMGRPERSRSIEMEDEQGDEYGFLESDEEEDEEGATL